MVMRTRKFASEKSLTAQVRPQVSAMEPRKYVLSTTVTNVILVADHDVPPSKDSYTHISGPPVVPSTLASRRNSTPSIVEPAAMVKL